MGDVVRSAEDILIRRIRDDDWPTLRSLRLRSLADSPDAFGQSLDEAMAQPDAEWAQVSRAASQGEHRAWYLAFDRGAPVGLVQGRRRRPGTLLLFSMWVAPEVRRCGVGARLIAALEDWAREWQATETVLWVILGNQPALAFYRRLGFEVLAEGPDAASGAEHGALAAQRPIDPSI